MPAMTIRNLPEEIHRGLKARAAAHGRSAEAEARAILAAAIQPEAGLGTALTSLWAPLALTDEEAATIEAVRDRKPARPMDISA